jgi:hypothetical protein
MIGARGIIMISGSDRVRWAELSFETVILTGGQTPNCPTEGPRMIHDHDRLFWNLFQTQHSELELGSENLRSELLHDVS